MGNQIEITPTTFVDGDGDEKYGVRIHDNGSSLYIDTWEEVPAEDMDILHLVLEDDNSDIVELVQLTVEHKSNIYIGENFYKWEEIEKLFNNVLELD